MGKDFKGTDLRDGADTQETEYETPGGSMCGVYIPAGSYTAHELAALINTHSPTHTAKVLDGRIETREAHRGSDGATLQPMASVRSPGETLYKLLPAYIATMLGSGRAHDIAAEFLAPYLARIADLEGAYRGAANERDIVSARDDAKSLRITALEADLAMANARADKLDGLLAAEIKRWFEANDRALVAAKGRTTERERADKLEAENRTLRDAAQNVVTIAGAMPQLRIDPCCSYIAEPIVALGVVLASASRKERIAPDHVHELGSCSYCDKRDTAEPNTHDGCLDCAGTGWSGGNVRNGACDVPRFS